MNQRPLVTTQDWFGQTWPFAPSMSFEVIGDRFLFRFEAPKAPRCDLSLGLGDFVEGLWERDVAEFFVAGIGPSYQEINISPTGAWWSAVFSDYRELKSVAQFEPKITADWSDQRWAVSFESDLYDLEPWRESGPDQRLISPAAILHTPEPHYFAWNHRGDGEPDFHRSDLFKPIGC